MSASSPVRISSLLNPDAPCYEPQSSSYGYYPSRSNMGERSALYNSLSQPYPQNAVFGSERMMGKKKNKVKRWDVPPRLKLLRKYPVHSTVPIWHPVKANDQKIEASVDEEPVGKLDGKTSLMIRNIPNHFRRSYFLKMLDHHCWSVNNEGKRVSNFPKSAYDFFYLPMDFGFGLNLGFAFVNFTSLEGASRFYKAFNNKRKWSCGNGKIKICEIDLAKLQGKEAFLQQFKWSTFCCRSDQYLPVEFHPPRNGYNSSKSKPTPVGRFTQVSVTSRVMIMTQRKERKA